MSVTPETIKTFRQFTDELLTKAEEILGLRVKCADDDDLGVMAIMFAAKQVEHLLSIHVLIDNDRRADATIIARVMPEGLALLIWASKEPLKRPRDWRSYSLVFDLETLRDKQARGEMIHPDVEKEILGRVAAEAVRFLKLGSNAHDPASYKRKWHLTEEGKILRITDILRDVADARFVDLYGDLSNWIHWNAKGISAGLHPDGQIMHMRWDSNHYPALAYAAAFQALYQCLEIVDEHFKLGKKASLADLASRYVATLGKKAEPPN